MPPKSVLFVCLGNICRSPSAEAVMKKIIKNQSFSIHLDSAGTANYHTGSPPDERAIFVGKSLGYDLTALQARQVNQQDFYEFDVIFAMDENNFKDLQKIKPTDATAQVMMFDKIAIADPYYGDVQDFKAMFLHIEQASQNWLQKWCGGDNHE